MEIRQALPSDLETIEKLYEAARAYMCRSGNPSQWAGGYPQKELVERDIAAGSCYVCMQEEKILGVFCYFEQPDPTYRRIYEGAWLNQRPYGVIHRIAVGTHGRGVADFCYDWCFSKCRNLKIDTHRDNLPMQKSLEKNGFLRCGIIYLENGDARIAYQKIQEIPSR